MNLAAVPAPETRKSFDVGLAPRLKTTPVGTPGPPPDTAGIMTVIFSAPVPS